ncbi:major facilitator superfamily domain-containing protein [Yarrowia lipolytica]|jgi:SHS family lactate transporter-like MFS transporter|uniref:Major facilitator superfamily (MFS) profile domain-containing protein n=1 Tax=Yarrowia lipolytica TaxID=4952 RepID=A0A1D8NG56_YARLL|nr:hypothetical protein YALI1_D32568g [Yarrowia lipolytica]KAB8283873.1 major facilitator superfamily domain-containing protein [Yarrowia lipolytica]KAE8170884.1 major facilitator superfamily domain-containing protein [Yarrowia lipolytica]KAJ8053969.1 major facilitator superfamily domain-containing protein [Yarrowia lipolytica]RDW37437.1 major facilitator superfamily domain-containing protein [Yarrowia lipolytica]
MTQSYDVGNLPPPDLSWRSVKRYLASRVTTLKPQPLSDSQKRLLNPIPTLRLLTFKQWMFVLVAFWGWTWDAFDFFSVSLVASEIAETLQVSVTDITWGITLVLMLRSIGAVVFGVLSDKYGRKWPFISNLVLFIVLELGTGFVTTYKQFLAVRALFGIAMGGIYGMAAATALEDCPVDARGLVSGILQEGYALGYLLCVVFTRALVYTTPHGWRSLFWFGAGPPVLIIIFRMALPETDTYIQSKHNEAVLDTGKNFFVGLKTTFSTYWLTFIYLVILMSGFNFMSHGSQDLYPTRLKNQLEFSPDASTVTNCVANLGAIAGGIFMGHISSFAGRRLCIMISCVVGGALIYPWAFVSSNAGINAGVFFLQFCVAGAWGIIPIHLTELAPPALRSSLVGLAYQLGNLASSASSTIEAKIGERFPLTDAHGNARPGVYDYSLVMAILMGCVFFFVLVCTFLGPENRNAEMVVGELVGPETKLVEDEAMEVYGERRSEQTTVGSVH